MAERKGRRLPVSLPSFFINSPCAGIKGRCLSNSAAGDCRTVTLVLGTQLTGQLSLTVLLLQSTQDLNIVMSKRKRSIKGGDGGVFLGFETLIWGRVIREWMKV